MSRRLPPLPALAAFEAVARHLSFAKAADELSISQSAVSHRITGLERHFNTRFFVRSNRAVSLTTEGKFFLDAVTDAFSVLENAYSQFSARRKVARLSVGPAFARAWLIRLLGDFYGAHPDIDLELTATKLAPEHRLACLRTGEADVSIRYGSPRDWTGFKSIELTRTHLFPVCSPDYQARVGKFTEPRALLDATLLRSPRQPWAPWFKASGVDCDEPQHGPQFSDAALTLHAAALGQGVALAHSTLVASDLHSGRLVQLFDVRLRSDNSYHAIYAAAAAERAEIRTFLDWIATRARASAPALPARH